MHHISSEGFGIGDATTNVAMKLDWDRFADLVVDSIAALTAAKGQ
jgi:hypothetical protein